MGHPLQWLVSGEIKDWATRPTRVPAPDLTRSRIARPGRPGTRTAGTLVGFGIAPYRLNSDGSAFLMKSSSTLKSVRPHSAGALSSHKTARIERPSSAIWHSFSL
jgi:hypothetical protein